MKYKPPSPGVGVDREGQKRRGKSLKFLIDADESRDANLSLRESPTNLAPCRHQPSIPQYIHTTMSTDPTEQPGSETTVSATSTHPAIVEPTNPINGPRIHLYTS